jgi:hypothetical protein
MSVEPEALGFTAPAAGLLPLSYISRLKHSSLKKIRRWATM